MPSRKWYSTRDMKYDCPKLGSAANLNIKVKTIEKPNQSGTIDLANINSCSGSVECGVETAQSNGSSYDWSICPFIKILRK